MMFGILYFLILLEVAWDSFHELKLNKSPDYESSNIVRLILGACYWIAFPVAHNDINVWQWLWIPVLMLSNFWFVFDTSLNLVRKAVGQDKALWYLGNNSLLDLWQKQHGGAKLWFKIKAALAVSSLIIFYLLNLI